MENAKDTTLTQWSPVVVQSRNRVQLCDLMDSSMPGFPVLRYLLEFVQIHVHWISDTIQPSHPLLPPSPPALNRSQHQFFFFFSPMSCLVPSGGQAIEASAPISVFTMNIQCWFPLGVTGLICLESKELSRLFFSTTIHHNSKHEFFGNQTSLWFNSHILTWLLEKTYIILATSTFSGKVMSLFFNMLSRFVIAFLPRSKGPLISWLQSSPTVIMESKKIKSDTNSTFSPSICYEMMGLDHQ